MPTTEERLAFVEGRMSDFSSVVEGLRQAITGVEQRLASLEARMDQRFASVDQRFVAMVGTVLAAFFTREPTRPS